MPGKSYRIFDLVVESEIELFGLAACTEADVADVRIKIGKIDVDPVKNAKRDSDLALLEIDGIGRYLVSEGREILLEPAPGAHDRNLRLYLLGSAMGLLLHQRGLLPLHANAVEIEGKAFAFMGPSGSGKSTLAAWFHDRGLRIVADDVCVIGFDQRGHPHANPGLPRLRLWREVLELTGRDPVRFEHAYAGDPEWEKYDVPLSADYVATTPVRLAAIYLLERGDPMAIEPLSGVAAAKALFANTYRGEEVVRSGKPREHWEACMRLVKRLPIFSIRRPWELSQRDAQGRVIIDHVRALLASDGKSH